MKKISAAFFFALSTLIYAQGIQFETSPFKDILAKAKKENKLVFLDAYAAWCGPCKLMDKNVFSLKNVGDYYNANFVNAKIDMEKGEGREIAKKYGVRSYPTYLFLDGDGKVVTQGAGYMEQNAFVDFGKNANNPENSIEKQLAKFDKGEKDPEFLLNLIRKNFSSNPLLAKRAAERYFENKTAGSIFTQDEVNILLYFLKSPDDSLYKTFVTSKSDIIKLISEDNYSKFNQQLQLVKIVDSSIDHTNKTINESYFLENAEKYMSKEEAQNRLNQLKLGFYEQTGNFEAYEKTALAYFKDGDKFGTEELLKAAWVFSDSVTNKKSLEQAADWAQRVVMRGENADNTYILAKLYLSIGKKDLAATYAQYSKELAQRLGKDTKIIDQLIKQINP